MDSDNKFIWWVVSWLINVGWFAVAVASNNVLLAIGAGIYTVILVVWELPDTSSEDD